VYYTGTLIIRRDAVDGQLLTRSDSTQEIISGHDVRGKKLSVGTKVVSHLLPRIPLLPSFFPDTLDIDLGAPVIKQDRNTTQAEIEQVLPVKDADLQVSSHGYSSALPPSWDASGRQEIFPFTFQFPALSLNPPSPAPRAARSESLRSDGEIVYLPFRTQLTGV
jgi:hypothetical protein